METDAYLTSSPSFMKEILSMPQSFDENISVGSFSPPKLHYGRNFRFTWPQFPRLWVNFVSYVFCKTLSRKPFPHILRYCKRKQNTLILLLKQEVFTIFDKKPKNRLWPTQ